MFIVLVDLAGGENRVTSVWQYARLPCLEKTVQTLRVSISRLPFTALSTKVSIWQHWLQKSLDKVENDPVAASSTGYYNLTVVESNGEESASGRHVFKANNACTKYDSKINVHVILKFHN